MAASIRMTVKRKEILHKALDAYASVLQGKLVAAKSVKDDDGIRMYANNIDVANQLLKEIGE